MQIHVSLRQRGWYRRTRDLSHDAISYTSFTLYFDSPPAHIGGPILAINMSYDVFSTKEVPFGDRDESDQYLGVKSRQSPILGAWKGVFKPIVTREILGLKLAHYRNYRIDSNQILQSDKDHQMLFARGPKLYAHHKSKMADGCHPGKIEKSP